MRDDVYMNTNFREYLENTGWTVKVTDLGLITLSHSEHGIISIVLGDQDFTVRHAGAVASIKGRSGKNLPTLLASFIHTFDYIKALNENRIEGKRIYNRSSQ